MAASHAFRSRSGVAVLVVLALLAITLTVSYAVLRSQTTSAQVDSNHGRMDDARSAALSGISAGLRRIHTSSWNGVGSQFTGDLGHGTSYLVTYTAGDPQLVPSDSDYHLLPYRVTITSKGTSNGQDGSSSKAEHTIEVVVQLVPRAFQSTPSNWSNVQSHTLYQWQDQPVTFELPVQVAGKVHSQGTLNFAPSYPTQGVRAPFHGHIDEVAIYNKSLTAAQILAIYSAAALGDPTSLYTSHGPIAYWKLNEPSGTLDAVDAIGNYHGLYISAKPGQNQAPFSTAAISTYFDGINDHVDCGRFTIGGSNITVLAWIRPQSLTNDMRIISQGTGDADSEQSWKLAVKKVGSNYRLQWAVCTSGFYRESLMNIGSILPNTWVFVAGVYDGSQISLYKDGVLANSHGFNGTLTTAPNAFITIGDVPPGSPRSRLLADYYRMQQSNVADHRPLTGEWSSPSGKVSTSTENLVEDDLKIQVESTDVATTAPVSFPSSAATYQLFPGGPIYSVPYVSNQLSDLELHPDPLANPLGIYRCSSDLNIRNNVVIEGSIILEEPIADLTLDNNNVTWTPVNLLSLADESLPRQLPIAMVPACFIVNQGITDVNLEGQIVAGDRFELLESNTPTRFNLRGSCVCGKMSLNLDTNWPLTTAEWKSNLQSFLEQRATGIAYFPQWLESTYGFQTSPRVTMTPENSSRIYHWPDFSQALYQPHPTDPGLRWQVVSWTDQP